jgi:tetratricopeptide (TPR) repeat protein
LAESKKIFSAKAGVIACFFLLSFFNSSASDNLWQFDPELQKAHSLILGLETDNAYALLQHTDAKANELHKLYLLSLCETVDILITEDEKKFRTVEANFKKRLTYLENLPVSGETLFLQAELNLQLGFNYLNLSQEFNAVLAIRRAYNLIHDCQKKYPAFIPAKKTDGVIQVMVGSVPDKYRWFMGLLGMKGSVIVGQKELESLKASKSSLNIEATVLYFTIKGFINQQFDEASKGILDYLKTEPENRLLMFLAVNMLIKNSQSEEAYKLIQALDRRSGGLPIYYMEYLRGEILMEQGDYGNAIQAYQKFIAGYRSLSFKKDSYYKISLCYWLQNKTDLAKLNFEKAKKTGRDVAEPDKYAARQLEEPAFPNAKILKVRFYTDGGYYKEAKDALQNILPSDLPTFKDRTEYFYRKARLAHKTGELSAAKLFYQQSIDMTGQNPWYFAPNSALQLGYIAETQKDYPAARKYFEKAMSYKRHEYKNSIDNKAKSALEQIPN